MRCIGAAALWDARMIGEAEHLLFRAASLGRIGRVQLEAAIQSGHAARLHTGHTDWSAIVGLYDGLVALTNSLMAQLNRAAAVVHAEGAAGALPQLDALADALGDYQPYWALRAHELEEVGPRRRRKPRTARPSRAHDAAVIRHLREKSARLSMAVKEGG